MIEESSPSDWREVGDSTLPGPLKDADGHTALEVAQSGADIPTLSKIVRFENESFEKQDHLRYHYSRSLTIAAKSGDLDVVDRLIEAGDDLDLNASRPLYRIDSTAIEEAVKAGHYVVVQRLLKGERDITSAEGYFNMEALEAAVENEQHDEVERLRKNQKVLAIIKGAKGEALKLSCGQKDLRIVKALVEAGADPNSAAIFSNSDEYGISTAAKSGYLDVVEYLIKNGAHVNLPNFGSVEKLTPLSAAAKGGYLEIIDILLKAGADIKDNALQEAAGGGHITIVDRLLDAGASPNQVKKRGYPPDMELRYIAEPTALQRAAMGGHSEIAELLLKAGADVNVLLLPSGNGRTALQAAAENGSLDIVKMLLAAGADVNAPLVRGGVTALQAGAKSGNLEIVNLLLKNGAELDEDATSRETLPSLALAAEGGNLKVVKTLLHAMEISALFDEARITAHCIGALNEAAARGHGHVVRYFLEVGTPAEDGTYRQHFSLLASAVDSGNIEILKMLLKAKTKLKPKVSLEPAFDRAVRGDRLDMMELLLVARADLNSFSGQLNSALIFASEKGNYALVRMLLSAASDIDAVDVDETALAKAIDRAKNEEVLDILREKQTQLTAVAENMIERTWEVVEKPLSICDGSLCSICAPKLFDIFVTPRCLDSMDFILHPSLKSLQASVDAGCLFCTFFQKQFDYDEMPLLQGSPVPIYRDISMPGLLWCNVNTNIYRDYKRLGPITAAFNFITEPFEGKRSLIPGDTSSSKTIKQIKSWINDCITGHETCRRYLNDMFLPTRLIDLGSCKDSKIIQIQLINTKNLPAKDTNYITLSHCQHDALPDSAKTTQASLKSNAKHISVPDLPLTFQHCIRLARSLNIRYLWIDTLCIIQDSSEDSEREFKLINDIYMNSYCTVAAAAPLSDTQEGLFRSISTDNLSVEFECESLIGEKKKVLAMKSQPSWVLQYMAGPLSKSPRALLERELSPRVLHFTESEVLWECRTLKAMETSPANMPNEHPHPLPRFLDTFTNLGDQNVFDLWHKAVEEFTSRNHKEVGEVLDALACLARAVRGRFEGRYIAGMWENDLRRSLAWTPNDLHESKRHKRFLAPTWSWASVAAATWYKILQPRFDEPPVPPLPPEDGAIKIVSCNLAISNPSDEFSSLLSAELHISAPIIKGVFVYGPFSTSSSGRRIAPLTNFKGDERYGKMWFDFPVDGEELGLKVVNIVFLIKKDNPESGIGLAIIPVEGREGVYRRVGIVEGVPVKCFAGKEYLDVILI